MTNKELRDAFTYMYDIATFLLERNTKLQEQVDNDSADSYYEAKHERESNEWGTRTELEKTYNKVMSHLLNRAET